AGRAVDLSGLVLTRSCRPVPGALVDLWHADDNGVYDNKNFRLRGHVFTDNEGRYAFQTIVPGLYPGRTTLSRQGPGAGREARSDHPVLFSRRKSKSVRRPIPSRARDASVRGQGCARGSIRCGTRAEIVALTARRLTRSRPSSVSYHRIRLGDRV